MLSSLPSPTPLCRTRPPPRLLNRVRDKLRMKHYSIRPARHNKPSLRARPSGCKTNSGTALHRPPPRRGFRIATPRSRCCTASKTVPWPATTRTSPGGPATPSTPTGSVTCAWVARCAARARQPAQPCARAARAAGAAGGHRQSSQAARVRWGA